MKKLFNLFALAVALVLAVACSKDEGTGQIPQDGDLVDVTFTAQLPGGPATKAISDGAKAVDLYFEVYDEQQVKIAALRQVKKNAFSNLEATVTVQLVKGQTYNFIFWAQNPKCTAYNVENLNKITIDYNGIKSQDETRDAFYAVEKGFKVTGPFSKPVVLNRPFAQLNMGTADAAAAEAAGVKVEQTKVVVEEVATVLYPFTGAVSDKKTVEFALADIIKDEPLVVITKDAKDNEVSNSYQWLSMNYLLVSTPSADGAAKDLVKVTATIKHNKGEIPLVASNVPVQRNWRTNLVGNLLTETGEFKVVIDKDYINDHNYDEFLLALQNGGKVTLTKDIELPTPGMTTAELVDKLTVAAGKSVMIDLNGHTIKYTGTDAIMFRVNGDLIIEGNGGKMEGTAYFASANAGGTITVNGGDYVTDSYTCFQSNGGKVYINGGNYEAKAYTAVYPLGRYTINMIDNSNGVIEIKGGVFKNFNPADVLSEPTRPLSFVAKGYKSVLVNGSTTDYEVVEMNVVEKGFLNGMSGVIDLTEDIELNVPAAVGGSFEYAALEVPAGKTITINLNGNKITSANDYMLFRVFGELVINGGNGGEIAIERTNFASATMGCYIAQAKDGGKITVNGGKYSSVGECLFQANKGKIYIKGGEFNAENGALYTLNHIDPSYAAGLIEVTGGKFHGFNPANNLSEGPGTDYVPEGYDVTNVGTAAAPVYEVVVAQSVGAGQTVVLPGDGTLSSTIKVDGGILDGGNNTLEVSDNPATNFLVQTTGNSIVRNLTIEGNNQKFGTKSTRAIYTENPGDLTIANVNISGVGYALNVNTSKPAGKLLVQNSTLVGWTSFSGVFTEALFKNVNFGRGNYFDGTTFANGLFRPYQSVVLENCTFESGFTISLVSLPTGGKITFKNCKVGTQTLTETNIATLLVVEGTSTGKIAF